MKPRKNAAPFAVVLFAFTVPACTITDPHAFPGMQENLQLISAGHTGCQPGDNAITNLLARSNGTAQWNATCKGKTYLCTEFQGVAPSPSISCAPAVQ